MTSCPVLCWLFHLQTGGHKGDIVWTLQEFITPTPLPWIGNEVPGKGGIKKAEWNVLASKTYPHLGCQRLTLNIFPLAAAASRRAGCQSVKRLNAYLMMSVAGEIGIFISPASLSLSLFLSLSSARLLAFKTCLGLLIRHREKDREGDCLSRQGFHLWQSGQDFKQLSFFMKSDIIR